MQSRKNRIRTLTQTLESQGIYFCNPIDLLRRMNTETGDTLETINSLYNLMMGR